MSKLIILIVLMAVGCESQKPEPIRVAVPDTVRYVDSTLRKVFVAPIYLLEGDSIRRLGEFVKLKTVLYATPSGKDSISLGDREKVKWYVFDKGDVTYDAANCFPDSASACRALAERYEEQRADLTKKLESLECEKEK
jgi:hypothetical protein